MQSDKYIQVGEHNILIPEPKKRSDIFFVNDAKGNQYWQRDKIIKEYREVWFDFIPNYTKMWQAATLYNDEGLLTSLNEKDSNYVDSIYIQETNRRINGIHFMNDGELTWITGDHYFFLMYARMQRHDGKGQYADYREFQRDYAYLIHHCCVNENILGLFATKAKKTGITNFHWSGFYLNRATLYKNKNLGYMNIDQIQAAKTFNDYFMYSYNGLISPLRADYRNRSLNDGSIVFAKSYASSKKNKRHNSDDDDLNTSVFCVATKAKAFDVAVMSHITFDEPTKYKTGFGEIWRTNKEAVKIQSKFNGRAWLFNYTPEDNGDSFKEARVIFFDSELKTINKETGQTKSGLICHHIPACDSWEGAFDKHGRCDRQKALKEIQRERDSAEGNKNALQAIIRQYANTKKEAWGYGGSSSIFDPIRLAEMEINLEELQRSGKLFESGELQWVNPLWEVGKKDKRPKGQFDRVRWVPLNKEQVAKGMEGKMRIYERMSVHEENEALKYGRDDYGNLMPPKRFKNVSGIDPADFRDAGNAEEGSMVSAHAMPVYNPVLDTANKRPVTKIIMSEYYARPDNPEEWYQDLVKWIIYHGCLVVIEANNGTIATRLEEEGLGHYMMFKNEEGVLSLYTANHKNIPGKQLRHIRNSKSGGVDTVGDIILYTKQYLQPGNELYNEIDYGNLVKSERIIKQWKEFESDNTKPYDLVMDFGYTLMCHENYLALMNKPISEDLYKDSEISIVMRRLQKSF